MADTATTGPIGDAAGLTPVATMAWQTVPIPGSTPPVQLARLPSTAGSSLLVRFPPGWSRPGLGHYEVAEEVVFLHGSFTMSGHDYGAGDYGWFPPSYTRDATVSTSGALAWAWFSGANRWIEEPSAGADAAEAGVVRESWTDVEPATIDPLGVPGRAVRIGREHTTYVVDGLPGGLEVPRGVQGIDLFDLATHAAASVGAEEPLPAIDVGPALVRVVWEAA